MRLEQCLKIVLLWVCSGSGLESVELFVLDCWLAVMLRLECIVNFIIYGICAIFSFIRWGFSTSGALALPNLRLDCADYLPQEAFLMCEAFTETVFKENHPLELEKVQQSTWMWQYDFAFTQPNLQHVEGQSHRLSRDFKMFRFRTTCSTRCLSATGNDCLKLHCRITRDFLFLKKNEFRLAG